MYFPTKNLVGIVRNLQNQVCEKIALIHLKWTARLRNAVCKIKSSRSVPLLYEHYCSSMWHGTAKTERFAIKPKKLLLMRLSTSFQFGLP